MAVTKVMRLCVTGQSKIFEGTKGTLYAVTAVGPEKQQVKDLRTFDPDLPKNKYLDYEMVEYKSGGKTTWTIKTNNTGLAFQVAQLRERLGKLEDRMKKIEGDRTPEPEVHPAQPEEEVPSGPRFLG